MRTSLRTSTSKSGAAKAKRAVNQLDNVQTLIRSLPGYIWKKKRRQLNTLLNELETITDETKTTLKDFVDLEGE